MIGKSRIQRRLGLVVDVVFRGSNREAADAAGVPPPTLHRILSGEIVNPSVASLEKLAKAYHLPVAWLLGEAEADLEGLPVAATWWWLLERHYGHRIEVHMKLFKDDVAAGTAERVCRNGTALVARLVTAAYADPERAAAGWIVRATDEFRIGLERLKAVVEVWLRVKTRERREQLLEDLISDQSQTRRTGDLRSAMG